MAMQVLNLRLGKGDKSSGYTKDRATACVVCGTVGRHLKPCPSCDAPLCKGSGGVSCKRRHWALRHTNSLRRRG